MKQDTRTTFSKVLKSVRKRTRLTQRDLAKRLEVGQQTVSKWERGVIVPSDDAVEQLLELFPEEDALQVREALTKRHGERQQEGLTASTAALATKLNLDHLTAEQYQDFCADLFHSIYPEATVNVYGVSGDAQDGLDIEIRFREGYRYTAQCKRVKNFGPQKVGEAVRAHTGPAKKKFLLITRPATRQTRDEAKKYEKRDWELWDIEDISRRVRLLPSDRARVLVDTYAPGQRKQFLGIEQPSPFSSPKTFFRELLRPKAIFSHAWKIVGRSAELAELEKAVGAGIAYISIVGAGGSGKSRLALELLTRIAKGDPHRTLRVLAQGASVSGADVEQYRDSRGVFLVEDAHDRDDLEGILSLFRQLAPDATLLFTTRPYRLEHLESVLARHGLTDRSHCVRLRELSREDLESLAREVLNARGFRPDLAEDIARVADRSPLFVVIASNLVAEKRLHPRILANEEAFQKQVLAHFEDVLTQSLVGDPGEQTRVRELLNLVAALQPVDLGGAEFSTALETVYRRPALEYDRVKQLLVDASVLVARGGHSRIVPDMLGDYILEKACSGVDARAAAFPGRVLAGLQPGELRNVLHNLAKLDWRLTVKGGPTARTSTQIWSAVEDLYRNRDGARAGILEAVEQAAYYLPGQALAFLDNTDAAPSGGRVDRVSRIIRNAAYHREYVRDAVERLWELGKDMPARLNSDSDHPIRQLQALASIEPRKPIEYIAEVVEYGLELLNEPGAAEHAWSPFEFLEQVLATEGHTHTAKGNAIQIGHFTVNVETLSPLRKRVLDAAFRLVEHTDPRLALRAIRAIGHALRYPIGAMGNAPAKEARPLLDQEFLDTLKRLKELVASAKLDPLIITEIIRATSWHAGYANESTRSAAQAILNAARKSLSQELTECLVEGWGHHRERGSEKPTERIETWHLHQQAIGRALREKLGSVEKVAEALRERLTFFQSAGQAFQGQPHVFIRLLCEDWPELARLIVGAALKNSNDPLAQYTEQALGTLLQTGASERIELAKALLASTNIDLKRRVACAFGYSFRRTGRLQAEDLAILEPLLADDDEITVRYAINALNVIATENPLLGKALFFKTNVGTSAKAADELASVFCNCEPLKAAFLAEDVERCLAKLVALSEIEEYWIQEMVGRFSGSHPEVVLEFLLRRITTAASDPRGYGYRPIPFNWNEKTRLRFRESGYLGAAMDRVLDYARQAQERGTKDNYAINELFAAVVGDFDAVVRDHLSEYLAKADTHGVAAVGQVLSEASGDIVFSDVDFVERVLRHAARFGRKRKEGAQFGLYRAATTGLRSGTRGKPFPQDVAMKKSADEVLAQLRPGSPARKLFTWIRDHAQQNIERSLLEAELIDDD